MALLIPTHAAALAFDHQFSLHLQYNSWYPYFSHCCLLSGCKSAHIKCCTTPWHTTPHHTTLHQPIFHHINLPHPTIFFIALFAFITLCLSTFFINMITFLVIIPFFFLRSSCFLSSSSSARQCFTCVVIIERQFCRHQNHSLPVLSSPESYSFLIWNKIILDFV